MNPEIRQAPSSDNRQPDADPILTTESRFLYSTAHIVDS